MTQKNQQPLRGNAAWLAQKEQVAKDNENAHARARKEREARATEIAGERLAAERRERAELPHQPGR